MTYESAQEAEVLKSYWRPGAPLENTLFIILDPNGKPIIRGGREPAMFFRNSADMATGMNEIAARFRPLGDPHDLPVVTTVRLGMNVAACDKLPLAVVVADNERDRHVLEQKLAPLSWSKQFIGKLTYTAGTARDLAAVRGASLSTGYVFVSPNEFGTAGTVVAQLAPNATLRQVQQAMQLTVSQHHPMELDHREHIRMGREQGVTWTSAIPVTDPQSPENPQNAHSGMNGPNMGRGPGGGGNGFDGPPMGSGPGFGGGAQRGFGPPGGYNQ
jgi:hypothetical protein